MSALKLISRSDILRFDRCGRLAYLYAARPGEAVQAGAVAANLGQQVEAFFVARQAREDVDTPILSVDQTTPEASVRETRRLLQTAGTKAIRQATFASDEGVFVAVDHLVVDALGKVTIYDVRNAALEAFCDVADEADDAAESENPSDLLGDMLPDSMTEIDANVTSSTGVAGFNSKAKMNGTVHDAKAQTQKAAPFLDAVVQYRTIVRSGQRIDRVVSVSLNRNARSPQFGAFLVETDITEYCRERAKSPRITTLINLARTAAVADREIKSGVGGHCTFPARCPFYNICHPAAALPGLRSGGTGLTSVTGGTGDTPRAEVDRAVLATLQSLPGPIAFVALETVMTAIPEQRGYGPWAQLLVQASVHVTDEVGTNIRQREWLASPAAADRGTIAVEAAAFLEAAFAGVKTVITDNAVFMTGRLKELARQVPTFRPTFDLVSGNVVDILGVIERGYYRGGFGGRLTMEAVLPEIVPNMTYLGSWVADGTTASEVAQKLVFSGASQEDEERMRTDLLMYSRLNTIALVECFKSLRTLAGSPVKTRALKG